MTIGFGDQTAEFLDAPPEGGEVYSQGSSFKMALRTFMENKLAIAGIAIIIFFILFAFLGPHLYHTDQTSTGSTSSVG
jgi:peptide/nickel transport system permease protein